MFIYNVTIKIDWSIHDDWVQWMLHEHMNEMVNTGCFTHSTLLRLLETDEKEGPTYAAQYFAESKADYNRYIQLHAEVMRKKVSDKWGNQVVAFRSVLEVVH